MQRTDGKPDKQPEMRVCNDIQQDVMLRVTATSLFDTSHASKLVKDTMNFDMPLEFKEP